MTRLVRTPAIAALLVLGVAGCATIEPRGGFEDVERVATERLDSESVWRQDEADDSAAAERVQQLIRQPLTRESAVQIALLQNPELQASFEALGIAQADFVQEGLLDNPVLIAIPRFGLGTAVGTNLEMDLAQNVIQLITYPQRMDIAETQYSETRLSVSHQLLELARKVRVTWYEWVAARNRVDVLERIEEAMRAEVDYALGLFEAGDLDELALTREQALFEEARRARVLADAEATVPDQQLRRLLGLAPDDRLDGPAALPPLPARAVSLANLQAIGLGMRLDLQAMDREILALEKALRLARIYRWVPFLEAGVATESDINGGWTLGPVFAVEVPIFDQGQAQVARLEAMVRERRRSRDALALDIRRDIRVHSEQLGIYRRLARRNLEILIPLRERIVALAQRQASVLRAGAFELLSAKRDEIRTFLEYVETLGLYWTSRAQLEGALGGVLSDAGPAAAEPQEDAGRHHRGHHAR